MCIPCSDNGGQGIAWPPLTAGRLLKRYKRFLADVALADGSVVTAHCPNSGRMTGCRQPGRPVYVSYHNNPKRKLAYTWELIDMPSSLVGVNTLVPNRLVPDAIRRNGIPQLSDYRQLTPEIRISPRTRLDIKLSASHRRDCYVEIKNCTLVDQGVAMFPDAPTKRGQKHLMELARLRDAGARAVIFFLVQRCDATVFMPAERIDPAYAAYLRQVADAGVEILVYDVCIDLSHIRINKRLPYRF